MYLCTIPLRWQNSEGRIIERFAYSEDFTKYSGGTTGNSVITIGDNQYGLTLPIDCETKKLKRDMRFPIDLEDAEKPDIYTLGNRKVNLNNDLYFDRGGTMTITLSYDAFNADEDKRVLMDNGQEVWICNYKDVDTFTSLPPSPSEGNVRVAISGNTNLKNGFSRTYTVTFTDESGNEVDWNNIDFSWNTTVDFNVEQTVSGNTITLSVSDDSLVGESFLLCVNIGNNVVAQVTVDIVEEF